MKKPLRVIALTKDSPEYGGHSGYYTQVFRFAEDDGVEMKLVTPHGGVMSRMAGKVFSARIGAGARNQSESAAELAFVARTRLDAGAAGHIANVEDHLPLLHSRRHDEPRWVATVHFPAPQWSDADAAALGRLGKIITLCRRDAEFFSRYLPAGKVACVLHGVDVNFFQPDEAACPPVPRVLFMGKWLRDFDTAGETLAAALERWPELEADVVVARKWAAGTRLAAIEGHPRVRWQEGVDDESLRRLYQAAWLLFLPLHETSANNALVEALACGTVPVINDVGGVRDYGGGTIFPMSEANDAPGHLALLAAYLDNPAHRVQISQACRELAVAKLDWRLVREAHRRIYEELAR